MMPARIGVVTLIASCSQVALIEFDQNSSGGQ
jgi:hypothetical protein